MPMVVLIMFIMLPIVCTYAFLIHDAIFENKYHVYNIICATLLAICVNWIIAFGMSPIKYHKTSIVSVYESDGIQHCVINNKLINLNKVLGMHLEHDKIMIKERVNTYVGIWNMKSNNYDLFVTDKTVINIYKDNNQNNEYNIRIAEDVEAITIME